MVWIPGTQIPPPPRFSKSLQEDKEKCEPIFNQNKTAAPVSLSGGQRLVSLEEDQLRQALFPYLPSILRGDKEIVVDTYLALFNDKNRGLALTKFGSH